MAQIFRTRNRLVLRPGSRLARSQDPGSAPSWAARITTTSSSTLPAGKVSRVMFFGTDSFSIPTLDALAKLLRCGRDWSAPGGRTGQHAIERLEVCTLQMKDLVQAVRVYAEQNNLVVHAWPPDPDALRGFDVGVVASFGRLIPKRVIDSFPLGILNVHASLLPRWRGASPVVHAILNGDEETGVSIMEVAPKHFDVGRVLATQTVGIRPDVRREELSSELAACGADLMIRVLQDLDHFREGSWVQDDRLATYAPVIGKEMFAIDWEGNTAKQVYDQYRALGQLSKLHSVWEDTGVTVRFSGGLNPEHTTERLDLGRRAAALHNLQGPRDLDDDATPPGTAVYAKKVKGRTDRNLLCIRCRRGWMSFEDIFYGPGKVMSPMDFFNGYMTSSRGRIQRFVKSSADGNRAATTTSTLCGAT